MGSYKLSKKAEEDLKGIWLYGLKEYGEVKADAYYLSFFQRFEQLASQPYVAPAVDHIKQGYRRAINGTDKIYYRIRGDSIEIMRILGRQDTKFL